MESKQDNVEDSKETPDGTPGKNQKFATVKERMDTLEKAKVKHPPLEKKQSSKLKIPDVFQSPQNSPLSKLTSSAAKDSSVQCI